MRHTREAWIVKIAAAWKAAIDAVFQTGDVLLAARRDLPRGAFTQMVKKDLPFGPRTAQMLMVIAKDSRLRPNAKPASYLPASWTVLYELSRLPAEEFDAALDAGIISPEMTRADVRTIANAAPRRRSVTVSVVHRTDRVVVPFYRGPSTVQHVAAPSGPSPTQAARKVAEALVAKYGAAACREIAEACSDSLVLNDLCCWKNEHDAPEGQPIH